MSKNTLGESSTLLELVAKHGGIRIPMIQRDYAQGRMSWANPRKRFINDLKKALLPDHQEPQPLHLDFVYGTQFDEDGIPAFCPLDGQQRLTTLFLLHWCIAARENRFVDFQKDFSTKVTETATASFSYQVRPGGRSFFEALVNHVPPFDGGFMGGSPSAWIREAPWFRMAWERDPTVAGTLTMLDAIDDCFRGETEACYDRLVNGNRITFQVLDLGEIGLHDDLYLRMNARGLGLSKFETFKARYLKHLEANFPEATTDLSRCKVQNIRSFARKIDKTWIDFIWCRYGPKDIASNDTSGMDTAFMNLFRAVALVSLDYNSSAKKDIKDAVIALTEKQPDFDEFEQGGWLDARFTTHLIYVLEALTRDTSALDLMGVSWFEEDALLDKMVRASSSKTTLTDYLQFAAYTRFVTRHGPVLTDLDRDAFGHWIRVVRNLTLNTVPRTDTFKNQLAGLDELVKHSGNILQELASREAHFQGFNQQQFAEERLKASLLLAHVGWSVLIHKAENHGYFRGQIDFLLDFSGAKERSVSEWTPQEHLETQTQFEYFLTKSVGMFDGDGLNAPQKNDFLWERALLAIGDFLLPYKEDKRSFLADELSNPVNWKRILRGRTEREEDKDENEDVVVTQRRPLLKILWERMNNETLEQIASDTQNIPPWRRILCQNRDAWGYCGKRLIWYEGAENPTIFLLSSKYRTTYAELFTFCLLKNNNLQTDAEQFAPLMFKSYQDHTGLEDSPHIHFHFDRHGKSLTFLLYCNEEGTPGFSLWTKIKDLDGALERHLLDHGFEVVRDWLVRHPKTDPYDGVAFLDSCANDLRVFPSSGLVLDNLAALIP